MQMGSHLLLQNMVCKTMDFYQPLVPEVSKSILAFEAKLIVQIGLRWLTV